jgi:hypothetical protein
VTVVSGILKRVVAERVGGKRPSRVRAAVAAIAAGATAAAITYGALRS